MYRARCILQTGTGEGCDGRLRVPRHRQRNWPGHLRSAHSSIRLAIGVLPFCRPGVGVVPVVAAAATREQRSSSQSERAASSPSTTGSRVTACRWAEHHIAPTISCVLTSLPALTSVAASASDTARTGAPAADQTDRLPWGKFMQSSAVWAVIVAHFCFKCDALAHRRHCHVECHAVQ